MQRESVEHGWLGRGKDARDTGYRDVAHRTQEQEGMDAAKTPCGVGYKRYLSYREEKTDFARFSTMTRYLMWDGGKGKEREIRCHECIIYQRGGRRLSDGLHSCYVDRTVGNKRCWWCLSVAVV